MSVSTSAKPLFAIEEGPVKITSSHSTATGWVRNFKIKKSKGPWVFRARVGYMKVEYQKEKAVKKKT